MKRPHQIREEIERRLERIRPVWEATRSLTQAIANALLPKSFCPKHELGGSIYHKCECRNKREAA